MASRPVGANRPHSAHGELTPAEFEEAWITRHQPALVEQLDHPSEPAQVHRHLFDNDREQPRKPISDRDREATGDGEDLSLRDRLSRPVT